MPIPIHTCTNNNTTHTSYTGTQTQAHTCTHIRMLAHACAIVLRAQKLVPTSCCTYARAWNEFG